MVSVWMESASAMLVLGLIAHNHSAQVIQFALLMENALMLPVNVIRVGQDQIAQ